MNSIALPDSLVAQLHAYERKLRRMETLVAVAGGLAGLLITYVLLFAFDRFVNTPVWARAVLTCTGAALAAWFAQGWAQHWLWERRGPTQLAKLLQKHFRVLGDRLQGVIELTHLEELPLNMSPALLRAAIRQVAEDSGKHRFEDAVPKRPARRWALAGISVAALTAAPFVFAPRAATNALERWAKPWAGIERYTFTTVETLPDDLYIPHGEAFELAVGLRKDAEWKPGHATAQIDRQEGLAALVLDSKVHFKFPGQTREGTLSLRFGDYLKDIAVHPLHRPELKELAARVTLPEYLGHPELRVPVNGTVADFLAGSSVSFEGKISRAVGGGALEAGKLKLDATANAETFTTPSTELALLGNEIALRWTDVHGLTPVQPYALKLGTVQDAPPRVDIQNLDSQEIAILPSEEVRFTLAAADDFGLKEMWVGWTVRSINEKPKDAKKSEKDRAKDKSKDWVAQLWNEWKSQAEVKPEETKPAPELPRIAGGQMVRELSRPIVWSPAALGIPPDSVVELTGYALDYLPKREPSTSWKLTIFVLSPEKQAERIRERMDQVLKQLDERIRDEERAIEENKGIAENKEELKSEKAAEEIKRVEAGEKANEDALGKLSEQMAEVMKEALKNKDFPSDTMAEWSKIAEALKKEAAPKMQDAAQKMAQAAQSPQQRAEDLEKAMKDQQEALDAMRQAAGKMKTTNENLFARNFYNRLRLAASVEHQISDGLKKLAKATVGMKPEEIGAGEKKSFDTVAGKQDGNVKDVDSIQNDMTAFLRRMPNEKYQAVVSEMEDKRAVPELGELATFVRANLGLKSVGRAKVWGDQLNTWAEMIQEECKSKGGGGEMDPDQMELMIALVRMAVAEDNIREQTAELERTKEKNPGHADDSSKLGMTQNQLSGTAKEIEENPKFAKFMGDVGPLLDQVTSLMQEVAGELHKPDTSTETTSTQGVIIEMLVPPDKKGGSPSQSPQMAQMQQQMQKMMQQMTKSRTAGGNNSKNPSALEGTPAEGSTAKDKSNTRTVEKSGGAANAGEWPEEFREALQAYFQALEERKK
ncbi:MAG: hypothetical protein ABIP20_00230 [Chthoniobacteraceae bacterium]